VYTPVRRHPQVSDETLELVTSLLDDAFKIPGTRIRFGLDAIVGLVPGLGDILTGIASFVVVLAAWQRGLPKVTQTRMLMNIVLDTGLGAVPFLGDVFDVAWKANRRNLTLLKRAETTSVSRQKTADWLFLLAIFAVGALVLAVPFAVLLWLVQHLR
jgi:hypothetical protein